MRNLSLLENQHFITSVFDIAQKMGTQNDPHFSSISNLADHADHALSRRRIEPVRRLVENQQLGPVDDRLRQLSQLLHAQRVGPQLPVACFSQSYIEESFM